MAVYSELDQMIVFFGDDHGSFTRHQVLSTGAGSYPSYVNVSDVVVSNLHRHNIAIFLGTQEQMFEDPVSVQLEFGSSSFVVDVGDVNGDDLADLVAGNRGSDGVTVLLQIC